MMASTTRAFQISDWWSFGMGTGFMWPSGTVGSVLGIGLVAIAHQLGSQTCLLMMSQTTVRSLFRHLSLHLVHLPTVTVCRSHGLPLLDSIAVLSAS